MPIPSTVQDTHLAKVEAHKESKTTNQPGKILITNYNLFGLNNLIISQVRK
jgi:hypothetical protein